MLQFCDSRRFSSQEILIKLGVRFQMPVNSYYAMLVGIFIVLSLRLTGASVRWHFVNFLVDDSSSCALLPFQRFTSSVLKPPFCLNWQPFSSHYHPPSLLSSHHLLFSPFQDLAFLSFSITAHFSHLITKISSSHSPQVKDTGLTLVWR